MNRAVLALAEQVDAAIAEARSTKGRPEQVGRRVGRAIDRVLESETDRAKRRVRRPARSPEELARLRGLALPALEEARRGD